MSIDKKFKKQVKRIVKKAGAPCYKDYMEWFWRETENQRKLYTNERDAAGLAALLLTLNHNTAGAVFFGGAMNKEEYEEYAQGLIRNCAFDVADAVARIEYERPLWVQFLPPFCYSSFHVPRSKREQFHEAVRKHNNILAKRLHHMYETYRMNKRLSKNKGD